MDIYEILFFHFFKFLTMDKERRMSKKIESWYSFSKPTR